MTLGVVEIDAPPRPNISRNSLLNVLFSVFSDMLKYPAHTLAITSALSSQCENTSFRMSWKPAGQSLDVH